MHYHGTPIGGSRVDAARFLAGRRALSPFARPDAAGVAMDVCQSFVLDNSAPMWVHQPMQSGLAFESAA